MKNSKMWTDDPLGKSLDWFITEWNIQAKITRKENKKKLFSWVNGD